MWRKVETVLGLSFRRRFPELLRFGNHRPRKSGLWFPKLFQFGCWNSKHTVRLFPKIFLISKPSSDMYWVSISKTILIRKPASKYISVLVSTPWQSKYQRSPYSPPLVGNRCPNEFFRPLSTKINYLYFGDVEKSRKHAGKHYGTIHRLPRLHNNSHSIAIKSDRSLLSWWHCQREKSESTKSWHNDISIASMSASE